MEAKQRTDANGSKATAEDSATVVREFLAALERLDLDAAMKLADPGIEFQNVPFPATRGAAMTRRVLAAMLKPATGFEARIHNLAADGPTVLTERTDVLEAGRFSAAFWVCGTFEVRDGKITLWRDRFDYADFTFACLRGIISALLSLVRNR